MNRQDHYNIAERLSAQALDTLENTMETASDAGDGTVSVDEAKLEIVRTLSVLAQVHATLATVPPF